MVIAVLRIRIHRIHVFLGHLDPDPDPLVRGLDPGSGFGSWIRIRIQILLSLSKNSKKTLDLYYFVTSF
jgi:hypothetical protein